MQANKITVLIVDDSAIATHLLKRILAAAPDIEVVGAAKNGQEGLRLVESLNPQVVCTDLHMPVMDGLDMTKVIMQRFPRPVLVVSVSVSKDSRDSNNVFNLLEAGALDVIAKPRQDNEAVFQAISNELIGKIRILAGVKVFRRNGHQAVPVKAAEKPSIRTPEAPVKLIVVGASTGGPPALQSIFSRLPASFSVPVVVVQHISDGFLANMVAWLDASSKMSVAVAKTEEMPLPGCIYFAPEGKHLIFDQMGRFAFSTYPPVNGHRPSVTHTMRSAVACHGKGVAGLLLTGMGSDGADGMLEISRAGGATIAQDEQSCVVFGMPKQAIALGAVKLVLPLENIAENLVRLQERSPRNGEQGHVHA